MNKNEELIDLLKFSNNKSLLIVSYKGELKELKCPFKVIVLNNVGSLKKGGIEYVNSVKITIKIITVYIIDKSAYYYFHFNIFFD